MAVRQYLRYAVFVGGLVLVLLLAYLGLVPSGGLQTPSGHGIREENSVVGGALVQQEVGGAGGTPVPRPLTSVPIVGEEEAMRRDAEMYARTMGVDVDTAMARLSLQDEIGELNATLMSQEGEIFGGLWIQHTPEYRIHIYVTGDEERIHREYIKGTPMEPYTIIERRPATLRELRASLQEASALVRALGVRATVRLSVQENRVEIHVPDKAAFERLLHERDMALPRFTTVVQGGLIVTRIP